MGMKITEWTFLH